MALKPTDKPEISKKWWTSEKPAEIKGVELAKALQDAEKALAVPPKKKGDADSIDAGLDALEALQSAVDKTINKECDKKKHKDLIAVLDKFEDVIDAKVKGLEDAKNQLLEDAPDEEDEEDEEGGEGKLFEKDYLYKMIKLMKSGGKQLNFGFGLNTSSPEASQLLLKRKGKPEILFKALKKTGNYSNRCLTCGFALADPDDSKTLVFRLGAGADEPPQIIKLGRRFLRGDKNLKFRKLKIILSGGKTLEDSEPEANGKR